MRVNRRTPLQDAQQARSARPQPPNAPEAYQFSLTHPELPRQLFLRAGYVEDLVEPRTTLGALFNILLDMRHLLATQINLSDAIVCLYLLDSAFANDRAFVQDCHDTGDLPDKLHVVLDDDDGMFLR